MLRNKKGFTLIEMLAVIAIIAVLVSIVIPAISSSTDRAKAATDAANLRSTLGYLNTALATGEKTIGEAVSTVDVTESELHPGAELHVLYTNPGFIEVYYVLDGSYYGLDYLSKVAQGVDADTLTTSTPSTEGIWYKAGSAEPIA